MTLDIAHDRASRQQETTGVRPRLLLLARHPVLVMGLVAQLSIGYLLICAAGSSLVSFKRAESAPSGIAHDELLLVYPLRLANGQHVRTADALESMRRIDGVERVAVANQSPLGYSSWNSSIGISPRPASPLISSIYLAGDHWLETIGASMHSGRDFLPGEYKAFGGDPFLMYDSPLPVILTASLAHRLYPGQDPLQRSVYLHPGFPAYVVGVIEDIPLPMNGRHLNQGTLGLILPMRMESAAGAHFLLRAAADDREQVALDVEHALRTAYPSWVVTSPVTLSSLRAEDLLLDRKRFQLSALTMAGWMVLTVLAFIVAGQWWLQRHSQELGLRRALGASLRQITSELRVECLLVSGAGIAVGFALSRLAPASSLPSMFGASSQLAIPASVLLVALVQLVVTWTVRRIGKIPPHLVSRSPSVRL
ncbi:FtsX-like permease family protein [Pseudoxanthomonas wuyuanensis]|uniref:FtsX-like permease family protein n=1 Tax=Pseudoxanthomonas wuyuanensis TaxID=1073196 RepID=UPI000BE36654|nr:FtsX-like permease family protein [Pseudoxanthomonas wuyuanensis]